MIQFAIQMQLCISQNQLVVPIAATAIAFAVHLLSLTIFVTWLEWGLVGVAISTTIHLFSRWAACQTILMNMEHFRKQLDEPWSRKIFVNLRDQFVFTVKGTFSSALPWWAADSFTLIASYCGTEALAAQTILRNITLLMFMFPVGISIVTQITVSKAIGEQNVSRAKY